MKTKTHVASSRSHRIHEWLELISSMRFAISLLSLLAIASIIGTVLKQNEPMPNYVNQFGPFWFEVFQALGLYSVYSSAWFLLIMTFLALSTSLCLLRNTPKMIKDMRSWRDHVREQSLRNFHHKAEWESNGSLPELVAQLQQRLNQCGYQTKQLKKEHATLLIGKRGGGNKLGYIFAHSAIVVIMVGGLLDSNLSIRVEQWLLGKTPFEGNGLISEIAPQHRLSANNPTFRGNMMIPEGQASSAAIIPEAQGVLIQDLPFSIRLKKFNIEYYSTGMPKLFVSDVEIMDRATGKTFPAVIKVNKPLIYQGVAVYQSSFEDGGSKLQLTAYPMTGDTTQAFSIQGEVGATTPLTTSDDYTIEWTGFRPFNVENMGDARSVERTKSANEQLLESLNQYSGSATKGFHTKDLKNVGASVQYKLRDKNGQAREFNQHMQSVKLDDAWVFLAGMRESPSEPFRYLRIPADDNDTVVEWMRLRAALSNPILRREAALQYARQSFPNDGDASRATLREQLALSAQRSLDMFAGDNGLAGYSAVAQFLEKIPLSEQEKAAEIFMKILNGSLWNLWQIARVNANVPVMEKNDKHLKFLRLASHALSDAFYYKAPVYLQLNSYDEVKASVFQVTRSPGKNIVYLGCVFLVLGIFCMFYIRNSRVWCWVSEDRRQRTDDSNEGGHPLTHVLMAMSGERRTVDFDREFLGLKEELMGE